jgi:hypothetical protein
MCCLKEILDVVELGTVGAGVSGACCQDIDPLKFCKCALVMVSSTLVSPLDALSSDSILGACAALLCRPRFLGGAAWRGGLFRGGLVIRYYVTSSPQPGSMRPVPSYSLYCEKWSS